jgi:hypothetical protein
MADREHPFLITDPDTGAVSKKLLLSDDQIEFSIRMALRGSALAGLPHKNRDHIKDAIERAVVEHFRLCGYQIYGGIGEAGPMRGNPYMGIERKG